MKKSYNKKTKQTKTNSTLTTEYEEKLQKDADYFVKGRFLAFRKYLGLTQNELAEKLGVSNQTYWNYEKGDRVIPFVIIRKLVELYKLNPNWLIINQGSMYLEQDVDKKTKIQETVKSIESPFSELEVILIKNLVERSLKSWKEFVPADINAEVLASNKEFFIKNYENILQKLGVEND